MSTPTITDKDKDNKEQESNPESKSNSKEIIIESEAQSQEGKPNRLKYYADQLEDLAGETTFTNYKKLLLLNSYETDTDNGATIIYKSRMLKPSERGKLRKLINEGTNINRKLISIEGNGSDEEYDKLWDQYISNIHKQGNLLIKDLTDEQFDNSDFYVLENLIVAWRMKYQGFRSL